MSQAGHPAHEGLQSFFTQALLILHQSVGYSVLRPQCVSHDIEPCTESAVFATCVADLQSPDLTTFVSHALFPCGCIRHAPCHCIVISCKVQTECSWVFEYLNALFCASPHQTFEKTPSQRALAKSKTTSTSPRFVLRCLSIHSLAQVSVQKRLPRLVAKNLKAKPALSKEALQKKHDKIYQSLSKTYDARKRLIPYKKFDPPCNSVVWFLSWPQHSSCKLFNPRYGIATKRKPCRRRSDAIGVLPQKGFRGLQSDDATRRSIFQCCVQLRENSLRWSQGVCQLVWGQQCLTRLRLLQLKLRLQ